MIEPIKSSWNQPIDYQDEARHELPSDDALLQLLNIAYHTTFLQEEGRRLNFRLLVIRREEIVNITNHWRFEPRVAEFSEKRILSIAELRRLAPAADLARSMICIEFIRESGWLVWSLLDTGVGWWQFTRDESSSGYPPPDNLSLSSRGPGELTISSGGMLLIALRNGVLFQPSGSILHAGPVSNYLEPLRDKFCHEVLTALDLKRWDKRDVSNDYPKKFIDTCLMRILVSIQELSHGGMLIMVPDELAPTDSRLADRINIKYPCNYDYIWKLMVAHLMALKSRFGRHFLLWNSKKSISKNDFQDYSASEMVFEESREMLGDSLRFVASLSAVDGAVIVTDRFRILGFGAEVIVQSPTLKYINLALNPHASDTQTVSIESYGTRHRSAFRFCSSLESAIAFIISVDGGIKAAKRVGSRLLLWPEVQANFYGM